MQLNDNTTYNDLTVAGLTLTAPAPYVEGHELTAAEAKVLNQTLKENLRNNFAPHVKAAIEAAGGAESVSAQALQEAFDAYISAYEFGVAGTRASTAMSSIDREIYKIARETLNAGIKQKGIKRKDISDEKYDELLDTLVEKRRADFLPIAQARLDSKAQVAGLGVDLGIAA